MLHNIEFPGPILVFDISKLAQCLAELYKSDYYPIQFIEDDNHEMLKKFRADFPEENIDCIIIPVRYLNTFLA